MSLQLLAETPAIALYHDQEHNWLYIDWQGELDLPLVQHSCLLIARYFLQGNYTKVLNDNTNVSGMSPDVSPWLAREYLPYIVVSGIRHIAWVYSPNMSTQYYTDISLLELDLPVVALFSDTATACSWLKNTRFKPPVSAAAELARTAHLMQTLKDRPGTSPLVEALENRARHPGLQPGVLAAR